MHSLKFKYFQYVKNDAMKESIDLDNGSIYGLSNGYLNEWDKVVRGKEHFSHIVAKAEQDLKCNDG